MPTAVETPSHSCERTQGKSSSEECGHCNSNVKDKVKYVPVELSALSSTGIVPMQLIFSVNPSHVLVVQLNCFRTADGSASVVLQSPEN